MYKSITLFLLSFLIFCFITSCDKKNNSPMKTNLFQKDNLFAWCIIPYDSVNRTSEERAEMLIELGLKSYAYDWREKHLPYMANELAVMKEKNIGLTAVWFWIDGGGETLFDKNNELIIKTLKDAEVKTNLWISFPERFFDNLSEEEIFQKAIESIDYTYKRVKEIGCTISLYNHGGWFGIPENQIRIIENLGFDDIGIAYNFLRGTSDMKRFKFVLNKTLPYLTHINLNGTKDLGITDWSDIEVVGPPHILTIGEGDKEEKMLKIISESDYKGPIGIIGHTEDEDVKVVIKRNLDGLKNIVDSFNK